MAIVRVQEAEGWAGIAARLAAAQLGDVVEIGPGEFRGTATLNVPSGVTLAGIGGHQLIFEGAEVAVAVTTASDVVLRGLCLSGYSELNDSFLTVTGNIRLSEGLIRIVASKSAIVEQCDVSAFTRRGSCVAVIDSQAVEVRSGRFSGARCGVAFWSSDGCIVRNETSWNEFGVLLARNPDSPETPSLAELRGNLCHDNMLAGIIIFSSESRIIQENECWRNEVGILIQRDEIIKLGSSCTDLSFNRCYDNKDSGIAILVSESENTVSNECWGNGGTGICIRRKPLESDEKSLNKLNYNQCHDNLGAGIAVFSSKNLIIDNNKCWGNYRTGISIEVHPDSKNLVSLVELRHNFCFSNREAGISVLSSVCEEVEGNACWGNLLIGISIQCDSKTLDAPSRALLRDNRCQGNGGAAVGFLGSAGSATGTLSRDNGINGVDIVAVPNSFVTVAPPFCADNITDHALDLPGAARAVAPCVARLPVRGQVPWSVDGMIGFVRSSCAHCFRAFWIGQSRAANDVSDGGVKPSGDPRRWTVRTASAAQSLLTRNAVHRDGIVADILRAMDRATPGCSRWLALVAPDDGDVAALVAAALERRARDAAPGHHPGRRLGILLDVAMDDGDVPLRQRIIDHLMLGRGCWGERLGVLCHSRVLRWLMLAITAGAGVAWFSGVIMAMAKPMPPMFQTIAETVGLMDDGDWQWLGVASWSVLAVLITMLALSHFLMPRHLRLGQGIIGAALLKKTADDTVGDVGTAIVERYFGKGLSSIADRAEQRWMMRRLFSNGDLAVLLLRDVTRWREGDVAWLAQLAVAVPADHVLATVTHIDGRLMLRPIFVDPVDAPWSSGFELFLQDDEAKLQLARGEPMTVEAVDARLKQLFAVDQVDQLRTGIIRSPVVAIDLLPTLPLASAPTARATITRAKTSARAQQGPLIDELLPAAADFFEGQVGQSLDPSQLNTDPLFALQGTADAVQLRELLVDMVSEQQLTGRLAGRRETGVTLSSLWPNGSDWEEYVVAAMRWGIWLKAREATALLGAPGPVDRLALLRLFEGLLFLGQEMQPLLAASPPLFGAERYAAAWRDLAAAVQALGTGDAHSTLVARYLAAEYRCVGDGSALAMSLAARLTALHGQSVAELLVAPIDACDQFARDTATALVDLAQMDDMARERQLAEWRALQWRELPPCVATVVNELMVDGDRDDRSLSTMFAKAKDEAEIEAIVRLHSAFPVRTIFAMGAAAVNHVLKQANWRIGDPTPEDDLVPIAETLISLRDRMVTDAASAWIPKDFAKGASGARLLGPAIATFLSQSGSVDRIMTWLERSSTQLLDEFEARLEMELRGGV